MLPDGELQKTCRLSPSNSKILAADLENKSRREKRDDMLLVQSKTVEVTDEGRGSESCLSIEFIISFSFFSYHII